MGRVYRVPLWAKTQTTLWPVERARRNPNHKRARYSCSLRYRSVFEGSPVTKLRYERIAIHGTEYRDLFVIRTYVGYITSTPILVYAMHGIFCYSSKSFDCNVSPHWLLFLFSHYLVATVQCTPWSMDRLQQLRSGRLRLPLSRKTNTRTQDSCCFGVALTLTHRCNAVRGHGTGSTNSGDEK